MKASLFPCGRAMLIGSQPLNDHDDALRLVLRHVPEIPNWVQLPVFKEEGMVDQFVDGLPALVHGGDRTWVDASGERFDEEMVRFFEEYLAICEQNLTLEESRFKLSAKSARGFFTLLAALARNPQNLYAVKGQITGPITFCTSLTDQDRRAIFYNDALRDAAVKTIALKAAWQVQKLRASGVPVIVFIDEPALAGYGSSELISISGEEIGACLTEVIDAIHGQGGLVGVHVCANTDWSLLLSSEVDIINFDAYGYFDRFVLYAGLLKAFLAAGGCLAWGMVPTALPEQVKGATLDGLWSLWQSHLQRLGELGMDLETVQRQSFITPSCGTGALTPMLSEKVLTLTQALSSKVRQNGVLER
jgi:methionine synthase II (cobalamin-independent)